MLSIISNAKNHTLVVDLTDCFLTDAVRDFVLFFFDVVDNFVFLAFDLTDISFRFDELFSLSLELRCIDTK